LPIIHTFIHLHHIDFQQKKKIASQIMGKFESQTSIKKPESGLTDSGPKCSGKKISVQRL